MFGFVEKIHFEIETKGITSDAEPVVEVDYIKMLMDSLKTETNDMDDDEWNF